MKTIKIYTEFKVLSAPEFYDYVKNDKNRTVPAYRLYNTKKSEVTSKKIQDAVDIFFSPTYYWMGTDDIMRWSLHGLNEPINYHANREWFEPINYHANREWFTNTNIDSLDRSLDQCGIDCFLVKVCAE